MYATVHMAYRFQRLLWLLTRALYYAESHEGPFEILFSWTQAGGAAHERRFECNFKLDLDQKLAVEFCEISVAQHWHTAS
jgi:hypothetical protein